MRLPAVTPAARAQRQADVLARCISIARTPEDAARYRAAYQWASARAASLDSDDVPTGLREQLLAVVRPHTRFLLGLLLVAVVELVFLFTAPAWLQADVRLLATGMVLGAAAQWLWQWHSARTPAGPDVYECPGCEGCDE